MTKMSKKHEILKESFLRENIDISKSPLVDVEENTKIEVSNILGKNKLINLLIKSMEYSIVESTENNNNSFELEKELKILDIDKYDSLDDKFTEEKNKGLCDELNSLGVKALCNDIHREHGAVKTFEGKIIDRYFDYPDQRLDKGDDKISFRIRTKIPSDGGKPVYYFTIKKKLKKSDDSDDLRVCFEKEYLVKDVIAFENILKDNGFIHTRRKEKDRIAFSLDGIKFDIDKYEGIPPLLEIEAASTKIAKRYMENLGLNKTKEVEGEEKPVRKHETSVSGSRGLFKLYDIPYNYVNNIVDEKKKDSA